MRALVQQRDAPAGVRPLVELLEEIRPRVPVALARRINRIDRDDVTVVQRDSSELVSRRMK